MGALGTDSTSNSYDERQASSGAASPNLRGANPTAFGDSSLAIGARGFYQAPNAAALSGKNNTIISPGAYSLAGVTGPVTIQQSDPGLLEQIVNSVNQSSSSNADTLGSYLDKVTAAQTDSQNKTLTALASLAQNQQTGGLDGVNKIVLYVIVAIVMGAVAVAYSFRRK